MCLTWLYKVTSSLNSFLNTGLRWYLLFKERCCSSCTCSDSLAEMRLLCWSIHAHNSSFLLGKGTQLYQGNFQTRDKVRCCCPDKQRQDFPGSALSVCCAAFIHASHEAEAWVWAFLLLRKQFGFGDFPHCCYYPALAPFLASVRKEPVKEVWKWAGHSWEYLGPTSRRARALPGNHLRRCLFPKAEFSHFWAAHRTQTHTVKFGI